MAANLCIRLIVYTIFIKFISTCPSNVSHEQILSENFGLSRLHENLKPGSLFSLNGITELVERIHANQRCFVDDNLNHVEYVHKKGNAHEGHHEDHVHVEHDHAKHVHVEHDSLNKNDHSDHVHERHNSLTDAEHHHEHELISNKTGHEESESLSKMMDPKSMHDHDHTSHDHPHMETNEHSSERVKDNLKSKQNNVNRESLNEVISKAGISSDSQDFPPAAFLELCPSLLNYLLDSPCPDRGMSVTESHVDDDHHHHEHHTDDSAPMTKDSWIAAIVSLIIIGLISLSCILVIPALKRSKYYTTINHFLLSLAVGSLAGDALIHLLSHAMTMEIQSDLNGHLIHGLYGFMAFIGIMVFLLMERLHNIIGSNGHSHSAGTNFNEDVGDGDGFVNKIGIISNQLNKMSGDEFEKNEEKLPQLLNLTPINHDSSSPKDVQKSCFESCPPLSPRIEDANGNKEGGELDCQKAMKHHPDHDSASAPEREKLVGFSTVEKYDQDGGKPQVAVISPPPLVQNNSPASLVRQDSKNFNMVLQEYHVGHHGHSHHGHSHVTGKKDSLRTMILLGDGMHTFIDGMAIGAAFGSSLTGGIATAIAVMCHELPHKVGDFAILFEMGMKRRQAVKMVIFLWTLSLLGLVIGVFIGSIKSVSPWIYCFTAGVFLYLALVDLLSELSINDSDVCSAGLQVFLQFLGMMTGALIMLAIAVYEHDLQALLESLF